MKWFLIRRVFTWGIAIGLLILSLNCGGEGTNPAKDDGGGSGGGGTSDSTSPTVGANINFSGISDTTITVNWGVASDNVTTPANLQYRLVKATTSAAIDTVVEVDAISGVDLLQDYIANTLTKNVTTLTASTTYFFAVVVKDSAGNKAIYAPQSQATTAAGTVVSPIFNPGAGTYTSDQSLQMTSSTSGAIICYTSNGATPACNATPACTTGTEYSSAITVSATATYKALACKSGMTNSSETSGLYTIDKTAPTIASTTPANADTGVGTGATIAVTFSEAMKVSAIKAVTGSTSCITGTPTLQVSNDDFTTCIPMTSSTPVATSGDTVFTMTPASALGNLTTYKIRVTTGVQDVAGNALASEYTHATGFTTSSAGTLTINSLTPANGTYNTAQNAVATTTQTGAKICYTTNGVDPTVSTVAGTCNSDGSTVTQVNEGDNIAISTGVTLKVRATKVGYSDSTVSTRSYVISPTVTSTTPADATTGFDPFAGIFYVNFSKTMSGASLTLNATNGACTGTIQISADNFTTCIGLTYPGGNNTTFNLTPVSALTSAGIYKVKVLAGLTDTSANAVTAYTSTTGIQARYYRTETIDGTNNFVAGETFATTQGASGDIYVTADDTYLYVAMRHVDIQAAGAGAGNKFVYFLFATDLDDANGLTTSSDSKAKFGTASKKMRWHWKTRVDGANFTEFQQANGATWATTWNDNKNDWRSSGYIEARVKLTEFGGTAPNTIKISAYLIDYNGDIGNGWIYNMLTGATDGSGSLARDLVKYIDFNRTLSTTPVTTATASY